MNAYQKQCIADAESITAVGPLPDTVKIYTDTCPECARLYMAWVGEANAEERATVKGQYMQHLRTCHHALARWQR